MPVFNLSGRLQIPEFTDSNYQIIFLALYVSNYCYKNSSKQSICFLGGKMFKAVIIDTSLLR